MFSLCTVLVEKQNDRQLVNLLKETSFNNFVYKKYKGTTIEEQKKRYERLDQGKDEKEIEKRAPVDVPIYFYHPDHLGTTNALTDVNGNMYQFFLNLPFGETMAEQTSISYYQTEFKFNGKELDSETGMYYYGARYYDPSLSIWMSVDPMVEKTKEAYTYTGNNPINFTDPTGRFKIPIHSRIVKKAMARMKFANSFLFRADLQMGVQGADYVGFAADLHFDGRKNYKEVNQTWTSLNEAINETVKDIGLGNRGFGGTDVVSLGRHLHTVQDFYAHSNYVELYVEYYKSKNNGQMPDSVPVYDVENNGTTDSEFKSILQDRLRTGDFHLLDNEAIDIDPFHEHENSPTSHNKMNKDKAVTEIGKLAEKVATEHSIIILKKVDKK